MRPANTNAGDLAMHIYRGRPSRPPSLSLSASAEGVLSFGGSGCGSGEVAVPLNAGPVLVGEPQPGGAARPHQSDTERTPNKFSPEGRESAALCRCFCGCFLSKQPFLRAQTAGSLSGLGGRGFRRRLSLSLPLSLSLFLAHYLPSSLSHFLYWGGWAYLSHV